MWVETLNALYCIRNRFNGDHLKIGIGENLAEKIESEFLIFGHENARSKLDRQNSPKVQVVGETRECRRSPLGTQTGVFGSYRVKWNESGFSEHESFRGKGGQSSFLPIRI